MQRAAVNSTGPEYLMAIMFYVKVITLHRNDVKLLETENMLFRYQINARTYST